MANCMKYLDGQSGGCNALGLSVTFNNDAAQGASHECQDGTGQRRRSDYQQPDPAAHTLLDLAEHQFVPNGVVANDAASQFVLFRTEGRVEEEPLQRRAVQTTLDFVENAVEEARNGRRDGRPQRLHVVHQIAHVAAKETDGSALHVDGHLADALQHVSQRQEGNHHIRTVRLLIAQLEQGGADVGHHVLVRQHDSFRVARRTRCVANRAQIFRLRRLSEIDMKNVNKRWNVNWMN